MIRERRKDRAKLMAPAIKKQLEQVAKEGNFKAAVFATKDGEVVASIDSRYDTKTLAVLGSELWFSSRIFRNLVDFEQVNSMTMSDSLGNTVICSFFEILDSPGVLGVISTMETPHRDLTDRAIEGIRRIIVTGVDKMKINT